MLLPVGLGGGDRFSCTLCGKCCETLKERPGDPEWPTSFDALAKTGLYGLRTERGLQVWPWEKRRMAREASARGREIRFVPSLAVLDDAVNMGRVVVLVWELDHASCPLVDAGPVPDSLVCGAYDARPLVCRAFPVVVRGGAAAYSVKCPSAFLPAGPDREGYVATYGGAFLAAEAGGLVTRETKRLLEFLSTAGALRMRKGASREEVLRRFARGPVVDLWDVLAETGAIDRDAWLDRLRQGPVDATPHA